MYRIGIEASDSGRIQPDSLVGYDRIQWSNAAGFLGRISPDYLVRCNRIYWSGVIGIAIHIE